MSVWMTRFNGKYICGGFTGCGCIFSGKKLMPGGVALVKCRNSTGSNNIDIACCMILGPALAVLSVY